MRKSRACFRRQPYDPLVKLAILGAISAVLGAVLGVAGLVYAGGLWVGLGLLIWLLFTRHEKRAERPPRLPRPTLAGQSLVLAVGAGSLAIGLLAVGFEGGERAWRWLPVAVGALACLMVLLAILIRLSGADLAAAEARGEALVAATVTIEGKRQTGTYVNEQPRVEFDLLVEPEGLPAYRVKKKATVPLTSLGEIRFGDGFHAKVDPGDEKRILIDWDAPIPREGKRPAPQP